MTAYVISDATMLDAKALQVYRMRATDSIHKHGGRFLARGGEIERLEGTWAPRITALVEFPSMEKARAGITLPNTHPHSKCVMLLLAVTLFFSCRRDFKLRHSSALLLGSATLRAARAAR